MEHEHEVPDVVPRDTTTMDVSFIGGLAHTSPSPHARSPSVQSEHRCCSCRGGLGGGLHQRVEQLLARSRVAQVFWHHQPRPSILFSVSRCLLRTAIQSAMQPFVLKPVVGMGCGVVWVPGGLDPSWYHRARHTHRQLHERPSVLSQWRVHGSGAAVSGRRRVLHPPRLANRQAPAAKTDTYQVAEGVKTAGIRW
eukprot:COSAG01_NODE_251_length_20305_cov_5.846447_27_plen_195_part_00